MRTKPLVALPLVALAAVLVTSPSAVDPQTAPEDCPVGRMLSYGGSFIQEEDGQISTRDPIILDQHPITVILNTSVATPPAWDWLTPMGELYTGVASFQVRRVGGQGAEVRITGPGGTPVYQNWTGLGFSTWMGNHRWTESVTVLNNTWNPDPPDNNPKTDNWVFWNRRFPAGTGTSSNDWDEDFPMVLGPLTMNTSLCIWGNLMVGQVYHWEGILPVWYQALVGGVPGTGTYSYTSPQSNIPYEEWIPNTGALGSHYPKRDGPTTTPQNPWNAYPGQFLVIRDTPNDDIQDVVASVFVDFPFTRAMYSGQRLYDPDNDHGAQLEAGNMIRYCADLRLFVCLANQGGPMTSHFLINEEWFTRIDQIVADAPAVPPGGSMASGATAGSSSLWVTLMAALKAQQPPPPGADIFFNSNTNGPCDFSNSLHRSHIWNP